MFKTYIPRYVFIIQTRFISNIIAVLYNPVKLATNSQAANSLPIKIAANSTPLSHVAYNKLSPTLYTNNYKLPTS